MKILIVHNSYGCYSGEEAVVDRMGTMFGMMGHEVAYFRRTTEGRRDTFSGKVSAFLNGIYSYSGVHGMREALMTEKPDVVNVHNPYPFISPAALFECKKVGVPVVMTVHNYRLACPTGLFMRQGQPCELCLAKGNEWGCVRFNCERSWPKSVAYALRNAVARRSEAYARCVTRFVCLTAFQRQKLIESGFDARRIVVIPNSIDALRDQEPGRKLSSLHSPLSTKNPPLSSLHSPLSTKNPPHSTGYVAYLGRLSYEKGYDLLLQVARSHPQLSIRMAGAQRDGSTVALPPNVQLMGHLSGHELSHFVGDCRFIVMPSRCYEGFPMAILEGAQQGKPVIGPDHGAFAEIIGKGSQAIGRLFVPGSADSLGREVMALWDHPDECARLGRLALDKLKHTYDHQVISQQWNQLILNITNGNSLL